MNHSEVDTIVKNANDKITKDLAALAIENGLVLQEHNLSTYSCAGIEEVDVNTFSQKRFGVRSRGVTPIKGTQALAKEADKVAVSIMDCFARCVKYRPEILGNKVIIGLKPVVDWSYEADQDIIVFRSHFWMITNAYPTWPEGEHIHYVEEADYEPH